MPLHKPKLNEGRVTWKGHACDLTRNQFLILEELVRRSPHFVPWADLYHVLNGGDPISRDDHLIKVHIFALRRRLKYTEMPITIVTRRQWGYAAQF